MLVNVNGQICELIKAEAKGGNYFRRVPKQKGKGYNYYYDEEKYAASRQAHLDGQATRSARLNKAVLGAVDGAGKKGCTVKSLRAMAKKEGKEHVAAAIKSCLEKGDLTYKAGALYRKAMKNAKLEIDQQQKEDKKKKPKQKAMKQEPDKKPIEKSGLYLDELRKGGKGPIGVGKRGGKIYGYDTKGNPIYKPSEVPSKPAKRKPKKPTTPSPQLSLFGQTKLEKPTPEPKKPVAEKKAPPPVKEPEKVAAAPTMRQAKQQPIKDAPVGSEFTIVRAGGALTLGFKKVSADEVILVSKNDQPVDPKIGGNRRGLGRVLALIDYEQDVITVETPDQPVQEVQEQRKGAQTLAQKMTRVQKLIESEYPGVSQDQLDDLYRKLVDAQAGRPGSNIDAAIAEAEALLAKRSPAEHVEEQPHEERATLTVEQQKYQPTEMGRRIVESHTEKMRISGIRAQAAMGHASAQEQMDEIRRTRKSTVYTPEEEAQIEATWKGLPRSGPGWKLITKPYAKQKLKRDVDSTIAKIGKLPAGSQIRITQADGKTIDWRVVSEGMVTLEGLTEETPMPVKYALPELDGAVLAQVEVKPSKQVPTQAGEKAREEPDAKHDTAEQQAAVALPEIPPKPPKPGLIPRKEFGREMRRRWADGLYSSKNTYPVKEEIKDVGGVWDRYNNTWLLPSQEALDYIEALIPHKEAEQAGEIDKAVSEGRTVSGRTWDVRDQIKKHGGRWHGATKQWIMPDKQSAEMMQTLVERTTKGPYGTSGGKPTARQIDVASKMMQKVGREAWARTEFGKQKIDIPRARAMLEDLNMIQMSELIAIMKGDK